MYCRIHCVPTCFICFVFCPNNSIQPFMCLDVVSSASVLCSVVKKKQKLFFGKPSLVNSFYLSNSLQLFRISIPGLLKWPV